MTINKHGTPVKATVVDPATVATPPAKPKGKPGPKPKAPVAATAPSAPDAPAVANGVAANETEVALTREEAATAQLGQERILTSQLQQTQRQREFEGYLMGLKGKYEQGGKYLMKAIDVPRGVITLVQTS